jgi:asparagine synthase (glutamine-hydrolysing)
MCGICGKIARDVPGEALSAEIQRMMERMVHRGPDDQGEVTLASGDDLVGLGHRRLSIIDLTRAGRQPMSDEEQRFWIVYNGEVYNFRELRKELEAIGHRFRSSTDTEVVLRAYMSWGVSCLNRLEGMFALAIWDCAERRLLLARDRAGIKPLHYGLTSTGVAFASEIKSLLALPDFKADVDPARIDEFLTLGYISAPRTAFRGIRKLLPGHYAIWKNGQIESTPYWTRRAVAPIPESDWKEAFLDVFGKAVRRQMVSDVPIGGFLSGGIDSSLVVWMMSRAAGEPINTFAIGFNDDSSNEAPYAEEVANRFSTSHEASVVSHDALGLLPSLVQQLDEPFADSSIIPTFLISRETRKSVKVALSGDGGDELFAGYTNYVGERILRWMRVLPSPILGTIGGGARTRMLSGSRFFQRLDNVLSSRDRSLCQRYVEKAALTKSTLKPDLYSGSFRSAAVDDEWSNDLEKLVSECGHDDSVGQLGSLDFGYYLPNDMLTKVDRMSMLCSLEVRVPFLDEQVVDFAARVPSNLKLRGLTTKYLLRQALSDVLPRRITRRKKQGFGLPVDSWFSGRFHDFSQELLLDRQATERSYFEPKVVESILSEHRGGRSNQSRLIFALVCLELWFQLVVDRTP